MGICYNLRTIQGKKKMVAKIRKDIFITVFIISIAIFLLGFYISRVWDDLRINQVNEDLKDSTLDTMSILIEQEFLTQFNIDDCAISESRLSSISKNLFELGQTLMEYEKKGLLKTKEYSTLRKEYFLIEVRAYTNFIEFTNRCNPNTDIILYFYNTEEDLSERQGYALDAIVNRDDVKVRVFSIDKNFDDPTLDTIKSFYNITKTPTIIINNKIKKEGFVSISELIGLIKP